MSLASMLAASAVWARDRPALVFRDRPVSYEQLDRVASQTAGAFIAAGVAPGDRVAILAGNVPEFVYALYGTWRAGGVAVPLNVMLTHANLLANLEQMQQVPALAQSADDVVLLVLPLFHIYGLNVALNLTLKVGATGVLMERFHPEESLELIRRHNVTLVPGAPPMYHSWLELGEEVGRAFERVRLAVSGAAALPADVLESFRVRFAVTIWEGYGLTE